MRAALKALDPQQRAAVRAELQALGNLPRFEAALTGSGAIAQGPGAIAVGQQGVLVTGNVNGGINIGTQRTVNA
jgi:hypothetical protein